MVAFPLLQEQLEALSSEKAGLDERTTAQLRSLQQQLSIANRERDRLQADLEQQVEGSAKVCGPTKPMLLCMMRCPISCARAAPAWPRYCLGHVATYSCYLLCSYLNEPVLIGSVICQVLLLVPGKEPLLLRQCRLPLQAQDQQSQAAQLQAELQAAAEGSPG